MKKIKIFISLFFILLLTGCYNYRELNDLAITSAIGINKKEDGYELVIQVVNTQKQGAESNSSGDQPKFVIYKSEGRTIQEALRNVILESPKRLYINHLSLLILSEETAKDGLSEIIDVFARDSEFRKQFIVVVSKSNDTDDIIGTLTSLVMLNSKNIKDSIKTDAKYLGASDVVNFEDLLENFLNEKKEISLPSVILEGDAQKGESDDNIKESEPEARIILSDLVLFKDDKMIGYLGKQDSINVSLLKGNIQNTIYTYECSNNKFTSIEITSAKAGIKTSGNKPEITININEQATINEINCNVNLRDEKEINKLEKEISQSIKESMENTLEKLVNEFDSDIIGFQDMIYKNHPKYYKKLKQEYGDNLFKNLKFKVNVKLNLYAKGNILKEI